jgi:hypothetical protein
MGEMGNVYKVLIGKLEGTTPIGRTRHTLENNIRMDLREMGWEIGDWIHLDQDRIIWPCLVNTIMNLSGSIKCGEFLD